VPGSAGLEVTPFALAAGTLLRVVEQVLDQELQLKTMGESSSTLSFNAYEAGVLPAPQHPPRPARLREGQPLDAELILLGSKPLDGCALDFERAAEAAIRDAVLLAELGDSGPVHP